MWHIVVMGYLFVTIMFAAAQPSIVRMLIYLFFWSVLPSLLMLRMPSLLMLRIRKIRYRQRIMKIQQKVPKKEA